MSDRDELADVIRAVDGPATIGGLQLADAVLAAGYSKPRTVTTVAELDALPVGAMILDADPDALLKAEGGRWRSLHDEDGVPYPSFAINFPATVLYEPEAAA